MGSKKADLSIMPDIQVFTETLIASNPGNLLLD